LESTYQGVHDHRRSDVQDGGGWGGEPLHGVLEHFAFSLFYALQGSRSG